MSTRFAHFDGERGHLTVIDDNDFVTRLVTVKATPGRVVQIDDGQYLKPLRYGLGHYGATIRWASDPESCREVRQGQRRQALPDAGSL